MTDELCVFGNSAMWRKNPIPHIINQWDTGGPAFEPPCEETEACKALALQPGLGPQALCRCSGRERNPLCRRNSFLDLSPLEDFLVGYEIGWLQLC
jgi:hypothetical protein